MQKGYVLRRIAEALGRETGATCTAIKRDVAQRGEERDAVVKGLEGLPGLDMLGTLSRQVDEAFEVDVIRGAGALAADITIEWAEEFWEPENEHRVTAEDLDTLENTIRAAFPSSGHEIPSNGFSDEVKEALRDIYEQVAIHHRAEPIGESGTDRVLAVITALRTELGRHNS